MRCSTCGFPLSPNRAVCPRCGTPYGGASGATRNNQAEMDFPAVAPGPMGYPQGGQEAFPGSADAWGNPQAPWQASGPQESAPPQHAVDQIPFPGAENTSPPMSYGNSGGATYQQHWQGTPQTLSPGMIGPFSGPTSAPYRSFSSASSPYRASRPQRNKTRLGLTVASACIAVSAVILIFVYIMVQTLPPRNSSSGNGTDNQPTTVVQVQDTPQSTATTAPIPSPTQTLPGQNYIDKGRMASQVDENTGQVLEYATTFKTSQKVYVTFAVHSGTNMGAVCLTWYINNTNDNHYEFSVKANAYYDAFSYAYFHQAGDAYVEIAWASSTACTDKQLAQRVNFKITS